MGEAGSRLFPFSSLAFFSPLLYLSGVTLYQFILLSEPEQLAIIWEGDFLSYREEGGLTIMLYRVMSFYVELYYDSESNAIARVNPFSSKRRLELYFHVNLN